MLLKPTHPFDSAIAPTLGKSQPTAAVQHAKTPKTLFELLQRAAQLWPRNGITFRDQGWDGESDLMMYADLLREVEVRYQYPR
jgi:hypothetical protein